MAEPIIAPEAQAKSAYTYENMAELFESAAKTPPAAETPPVEAPAEGSAEAPAQEAPPVEGEAAAEEKKVEAKPAKIIKAISGDKELDIPEDALIPIKINGKIEKLTVTEISRRASGDVSIEKRHEELRRKEQESAQTIDEAKVARQTFANLREVVEKKDFVGFLTKFPEEMGLNPVEFETALLDTLGPIAQKWAELSDVEKKALVQGREVDVLKKEKQEIETAKETERKNREIAQVVKKFCDDNDIEQQVFAEHLNELRKLKEDGQLPGVERITPDTVKEYIFHKDLESRTRTALAKVNPSLADDQNALLELLQPLWGSNPSDEDLEEIVRAVHGDDEVEKKLNKKIEKSSPSESRTPPPPKQKASADSKRPGWNPHEEW